MEEAKIFDRILLNDEYIIKTYKPNQKRWVLQSLFAPIIMLVALGIITAIILVCSYAAKEETIDFSSFVPIIVMAGIMLFLSVYILITSILNAKFTCYAVTNKRLIAKIGKREDYYQYYDLKDLGYSQIRVTFWDKRMNPNTGTIVFSNKYFNKGIIVQKMNAPQIYIFSFNFIENPYEVSKFISTLAEQAKSEE